MGECVFCKIAKGELPCSKVYEDEKVVAFLDIKPINPGHTLVIPKSHSLNVEDISSGDLGACIKALKILGPKIMKALNADGFNLGNNNHPAAGQVVMHTHFHIIPRFQNDGLSNWKNKETTQESLQNTKKKIVNYLNK